MKRHVLKRVKISLLFLLSAAQTVSVHAFANPNLYYAQPFSDSSRPERRGLFSTSLWAVHGATTEGRDGTGAVTNVLGIYGVHKMYQVGRDVGGQTITDVAPGILANLWNVVATDDAYAQLAFTGRAVCATGALDVAFNLTPEFFFGASIPYYSVDIQNPVFTDLTPAAAQNAQWVQFLANFNAILAANNLNILGIKQTGIGDVAVYAGWTKNNEDAEDLDFADLTIRLGALLGNAQKKDQDKAFSIAPGYDGHKAFLADVALSIGANSIITLDFYAKLLAFFKQTLNVRMQTAQGQNGFIKLAKGSAERSLGSLYELGASVSCEVLEPMSVSLGYSYAHKGIDKLTAANATLFPAAIVNSDSMLQGWSHHVVHIGIDLNFTHNERAIHPHVGLFYNRVIKAHSSFFNHTVGGDFGLAITWNF